jgi:hypothetical protein
MIKKLTYLVTLYSVFLTSQIQAHTETNDQLSNYLYSSAAFSYRSDSSVSEGQPYLIPGAHMGGEALAYDKGGSLDDAQLAAGYCVNDNYQVSAVINAHEHNGNHAIELENFWLSAHYLQMPVELRFVIGKISSNITASANWHASQSRFSEASLMSDVFLGRHFNDIGVRSELRTHYGQLGVELWSGDSWPAANDDGAVSVYMKIQPSWLGSGSEIGLWGMNIDANNRSDNRYSEGHNHGSDITSSTSEYNFNGDGDLTGAYLTLVLPLKPLTFLAEAEWIQAKSRGTLANDSQVTDYENNYTGSRFLLGLQYKDHTVLAQHEELAFDNNFFGDVPSAFINNANLMNNGFEPSKTTYAWHWKLQENLTLKLAYTDLTIQSDVDHRDYTSVSLVWSKQFELTK